MFVCKVRRSRERLAQRQNKATIVTASAVNELPDGLVDLESRSQQVFTVLLCVPT